MYIKSLDIINIRSYKKDKLNFSKGINLILGPNNSGKSTILKCLLTLQKTYSLNKDDIRKTERVGQFRVVFSEIEQRYFSLFEIGPYDKDNENQLFYEIYPDKQNLLIFNEKTHLFSIEDIISIRNNPNVPGNRTLNTFKEFAAREDEDNFIYPFLSQRKTQHYSGQGGRDAAFSVADDLRNLPSRIQNLSNGSHPFHKDFTRLCDEILGFQIAKVPGNSSNNDDKVGVFATASQTIYLESMGEGVANILGLLSILLTEDNKLFLIEEIENDIHPEALKKLLNLIIEKSKTNQFIISTHSNIVLKYLATAENSKIFYADWTLETNQNNRTNLPKTTITEVENTSTERLKILEKLGYDLFDFDLYKSYVIFEESSAEELVRDFIIPQLVPELRNKIKTISAGGVSNISPRFDDFLRLFVFIHTAPIYNHKAWVIADGDPPGKEVIENLQKKFGSWPKEHFINLSKNNIEEYYPERFSNDVEEIKQTKDRNEKRALKAQLTKKVISWVKQNPNEAKQEIENSAKELVDICKNILFQID